MFLLSALGVSLVINLAMFLVAFRFKTDRLTDASYAVTFIVLGLFGLRAAPLTPFRVILFAMVAVWAVRLGGFLLYRIWRAGKDSRFDDMRGSFWKFGKFWLSQALAVWVILIAGMLALWQPFGLLGVVAYAGLGIWLVGVCIEATADIQKYRFTRNPKNKGKWIATGLWKYSRHPNYLGEILVWVGVYVYACTALTVPQALLAEASPIFIAGLLLFVSGIPILEKSSDAKWGKLAAYRAYKKRTSILLLWPPKKRSR